MCVQIWVLLLVTCIWTPTRANNNHSPESFLFMVERAAAACLYHNIVLPRGDKIGHAFHNERNWSVKSDLMSRFVGISDNKNDTLPSCMTADEVIVMTEAFPSGKHTCRVRWLSPSSICHVFQKYATIAWRGDSLTRHMLNALYMIQSGDLRYGAFPHPKLTASSVYENCSCDGQFSEAQICRSYEQRFDFDDMRKNSWCPNINHTSGSPIFGTDVDLGCLPKPSFLYVQGGTHHGFNATRTISELLAPTLSGIRSTCTLGNRTFSKQVRTVVSGVNWVTKMNADKYPHQAPKYGLAHNRGIAEYLGNEFPSAKMISFWNMTMEAANRTSDGFHHLTDINLMKAMILINIMDLMA